MHRGYSMPLKDFLLLRTLQLLKIFFNIVIFNCLYQILINNYQTKDLILKIMILGRNDQKETILIHKRIHINIRPRQILLKKG
jgi:hypothetical protein